MPMPSTDTREEQEGVVGSERRGDGPDGEDQDLVAVDLLASEDVRHPAEDEGAGGRGGECRRVEERHLSGPEVPLRLEDRDDHADDEQVVGIGEETHARDEHDLVLESRDLAVVERIERTGYRSRSCGHRASLGPAGEFRIERGMNGR